MTKKEFEEQERYCRKTKAIFNKLWKLLGRLEGELEKRGVGIEELDKIRWEMLGGRRIRSKN